MKLLFVSHEKEIGGASLSMLTLIRCLEKEYDCTVRILLPGHGMAEELLKKQGIPIKRMKYYTDYRRIGHRKRVKEFVKEWINRMAVKRLGYHLKKEAYDYVISNSSAVDIGARAALSRKIPHVWYVREFMEEDFSFEYRNKERMKKLLEACGKVIFISQAVKNKYISLYKIMSWRIIYNGVMAEDYAVPDHNILEQPTIQLLQIGRLCDGKGAMNSLKLVNRLRKEIDCHLTLAGKVDSDYKLKMQNYIQENHLETYVRIASYTNNIKSMTRNADILLMNSRAEGFGRVTVEGMLGGLLVVGRDAGGTGEIIHNQINGLLFQSDEEFVSVLKDINLNRIIYKKIAETGRAFALEHFTPEQNAEQFMAYLTE